MTETIISKIQENKDAIFFPFLGNDNIFTNGINIDRILFKVPGTDFGIYWYGFIIAIGLLLALVFAERNYKKFGISPNKAYWIVLGGGLAGVIGARTYYVIFSLDKYIINGKFDWIEAISFRDGGLGIYGGVIAAFVVAGILCRVLKVRLATMFDLAAMGFLIGQGIGRWGNFINQEAYGSLTKLPWGMTSSSIMSEMAAMYPLTPTSDLVVHPCFLYESIWCLLGFLLLFLYKKNRKFDGELFLMYIGWYGIGRGFIEGLRTDSLYIGTTSIRVSQLVGFICALVAIIAIIIIRIKIKKSGNYKFFYQTETSKEQIAQYDEEIKKSNEKKNKKSKNLGKAIENAFENDELDVEEDEDE